MHPEEANSCAICGEVADMQAHRLFDHQHPFVTKEQLEERSPMALILGWVDAAMGALLKAKQGHAQGVTCPDCGATYPYDPRTAGMEARYYPPVHGAQDCIRELKRRLDEQKGNEHG